MARSGLLTLALIACAPHEREDSALAIAPAQPMPDMPVPEVSPDADEVVAAPEPVAPCEARLADAPTALFGDRLLIRPPANVELREENPTFAVAQVQGGFVVTCDATLRRMMLHVFRDTPSKSIGDFAREFVEALEKNGYVGARDIDWTLREDTRRRGTVLVPAAQGQPEAMLLIDVNRRTDLVIALTFEASPADFTRLEPTLRASSDTLLVAPP